MNEQGKLPQIWSLLCKGDLMEATVRELTAGDEEAVAALQSYIARNLADPDSFCPLSREELCDMLRGRGFALGVSVRGQLVAFRVFYYPGGRTHNLGGDVGLDEEERHHVVHFEASAVHPDFRGNGLQQRLRQLALDRVLRAITGMFARRWLQAIMRACRINSARAFGLSG
ncbi:hypothetical protein O9H85_09725 [Paenibacillus filicis]|uniref:N-acetyltransferase domain-containing protein n=1 Tax=Paenibacillus gyeongsangnamensis TaxID=3388067 RepID=A0ABT4Q740_9BACL|nr:hypothetical protein [Paenibacillus filicis]MCZ8512687.1 hypothetical protein [Paenibacillus filicis]